MMGCRGVHLRHRFPRTGRCRLPSLRAVHEVSQAVCVHHAARRCVHVVQQLQTTCVGEEYGAATVCAARAVSQQRYQRFRRLRFPSSKSSTDVTKWLVRA